MRLFTFKSFAVQAFVWLLSVGAAQAQVVCYDPTWAGDPVVVGDTSFPSSASTRGCDLAFHYNTDCVNPPSGKYVSGGKKTPLSPSDPEAKKGMCFLVNCGTFFDVREKPQCGLPALATTDAECKNMVMLDELATLGEIVISTYDPYFGSVPLGAATCGPPTNPNAAWQPYNYGCDVKDSGTRLCTQSYMCGLLGGGGGCLTCGGSLCNQVRPTTTAPERVLNYRVSTGAVTSSPTPAATVVPTQPTGSTCDLNLGDVGRECGDSVECAKCSNVCGLAGNQPYLNSYDTATANSVGVIYTHTITSTVQAQKTAPLKVCLAAATDGAGSLGLEAVKPPKSLGQVDKSLVKVDGNYFRCMLNNGDAHRTSGNSCACESGYLPLIIDRSKYTTHNYRLKKEGSKLEMLWAQVIELIDSHPVAAKLISKPLSRIVPSGVAAGDYCSTTHNLTASLTPHSGASCLNPTGGPNSMASNASGNPNACTCTNSPVPCRPSLARACSCTLTCSAPQTLDSASCECVGGGSTTGGTTGGATTGTTSAPPLSASLMYSDENPPVYKVAAQGWGAGASGANAIGGTQTVMCTRDCSSVTNGAATQVAGEPNLCACTNATQGFSQAAWSCIDCPEGGSVLLGATTCSCPSGYEPKTIGGTVKCRPHTNAEYIEDADGYPICGAGRLPMNDAGVWTSFSTERLPKTANTATWQTHPYAYAKDVSGQPEYFYASKPHCGCAVGPIAPETPRIAAGVSEVSQTAIPSDYYGSIHPTNSNGRPSGTYGQVRIAPDANSNGRLAAFASTAWCGCPNFNEKVDPASGKCVAAVDLTDSNIRFGNYDPATDSEIIYWNADSGVGGLPVPKILLPNSSSSPSAMTLYTRKIYKCADGYVLTSAGKCIFDRTKHRCDGTSPVSDKVGGANPAAQFANARNKKLACCMNAFGSIGTSGTSSTKFDCIENSKTQYTDFNALWASSDDDQDGGQMNAFVLADAGGKPITGFYSENGVRCGEFSEFSGTAIQPGRVNPMLSGGQMNRVNGSGDAFESVGATISNPNGGGFSFMISKLGAQGNAPTTTADRRRCPVLVRAATVVSCPQNAQVSNAAVKTYIDKAVTPIMRRCAVAGSVQVKVRVEQVWEIAGQPKIQPIDTVIDSKAASSVSIDQMIKKKYGNRCPPGTTRSGDACVY